MKICLAWVELFYADGLTCREKAKDTVTFCNFATAPKKTGLGKKYFKNFLKEWMSESHKGRLPNSEVSSSRWRYSPVWALASSTICVQASRFLALSLHSFTPIFLRSMNTSSSHLIFGLPLRLVAYSFPYNIFLGGIAVSCILSIWPSHHILWHLINLTM